MRSVKDAAAPRRLMGDFKAFNLLDTSTGFLFAVIHLSENLEYEQEKRQTEITQTGQRSGGGIQQRQIIVGMTVMYVCMYVCCTTERLMQSECKVACRIVENDTEEGSKPTQLPELAEYSTSYAKTGQTR